MTVGLVIVTALVAALYLAMAIHRVLSGEWLPADVAREWRLSRLDLSELDRRWRTAPERSSLVISLTTIPSRIESLDDALKSMLDQTRLPARIILNVPDYSVREKRPYVVPARLAALASLEIRRCEDWGPATKLIPTVLAEAPDQPILIADDDRIYPPFFVERMEAEASRRPDAALTYAGIVVPADLTDRPTTLMSNLLSVPPAPMRCHRIRHPAPVDILLGVFGYLVRPRDFDASELRDFSGEPGETRFVDDVRSSALCRADKLVIPAPLLSHIPKKRFFHFKRTALGRINRGPGGNTRRHNTVGYRHFARFWRVGGPKNR
jgi:hypothetical protein